MTRTTMTLTLANLPTLANLRIHNPYLRYLRQGKKLRPTKNTGAALLLCNNAADYRRRDNQ
ncbi:MAG: hypothetical protein ACR2P4_09300 [Gammaproteobacteria bacterium]